MNNYIPNVWSWYQNRPSWLKWILFVFVIIAIAVLAILYLFLPSKTGMTFLDDAETTIRVKRAEKKYDEALKETTKLDAQAAQEILEQEERRVALEKERREKEERARNAHEEIDRATNFDSVDRALESYITRSISDGTRDRGDS